MAGRIRQSDVDEVKARTNLADIVGDYVTLKPAGVGSLKGLCPFHDERSPSFQVRPQVGLYHCFGCGEGGDVYAFLMKMDHVSFADAVERLAARIGYALHYEDGGPAAAETGNRARLIAANAAAEEFFRERLGAPDADIARRFLGERGFDPVAAERFGVGFAPNSWDSLGAHLRGRGFTADELAASGLVSTGERGSAYDRFRGRVIWPIRDVTGQTVGFGARRLLDDDKGPKYLNTPETAIYHKAQVLYGLDLAKREISRAHRVVVVEGYTDVMACHLAGVDTAVATCGTAFGVDHIKVLRRVLGDDSGLGEVVFTFDPDAAGQKAALRAFGEEQRFAAQTYVAVGPEGLDPCDLRLEKGDAAVRRMIDTKRPMFEFVIRQALGKYDLETVEGRVAALRECAPIVAGIRDPALRPGYTRQLARMLGTELAEVQAAVRTASAGTNARGTRPDERRAPASAEREISAPAQPEVTLAGLGNDPATRLEREALMAVLQYPLHVGADRAAAVSRVGLSSATLAVVRDAVAANLDTFGSSGWAARIADDVPAPFAGLVRQLSVAPIPARDEAGVAAWASSVTASLLDRELLRRKADALGRLQRTEAADREAVTGIQHELVQIDQERARLRGE
ncbi:DNA primase [Humibacter ginsenosidimutans]|uniref:DNA primase n=1 Tax=Humibacter ginsenosidimutans TaxID=2599293 RepID=A0A5B8M2H8_9MICO|nr:DNA primase [Humibacter ginsenosidimutans]QDZ13942.1 DNA primase [Humibacter ginsenosidimutans]